MMAKLPAWLLKKSNATVKLWGKNLQQISTRARALQSQFAEKIPTKLGRLAALEGCPES
ncbi:MAG TPA: hypothetical protein VFM21_02600 [Terriglobia bacterium]|nr:hypothetical protein [Terriglobia bacterium]